MHLEQVSQPCRNFQILGIERCIDPRDGREKAILANFAAGGTGTLIFVDPVTGAGEQLELPGDSGAWALLNHRDERLFVGTCGSYGYLHDLDLRTRTFAPPLRDPNETYIWNLCLGSDGMVYGGTYPGCVLLQFDPAARVLRNLGRVSENPANLYSRMVYGGIPGRILISCSSAEPHLSLWDIAAGRAERFGEPGDTVRGVGDGFICLQRGGRLVYYDSQSLQPVDQDFSDRLTRPSGKDWFPGSRLSIALADRRTLAVRGQAYYVDDGGDTRPSLRPIPATPPPTHILTVAADRHGGIWGSSGFGQTIFRYDTPTGAAWNSQVVTFNSGEVYGVVPIEERVFLSCYSGGDHVVYDPRQEWNQIDNINPRTLDAVAPALIRPAAKSVMGPDGNVWTGWMAAYGTYGGGLSRVAVDTLEVRSWYDPIPGQAIMGLAADDHDLYFITGGGANGLVTRRVPLHFVVWSPEGRIVWQRQFAAEQSLHAVATAAGLVVVAVDSRLEVYSPGEQAFVGSVELQSPCYYLGRLRPDRLAACGADGLWVVDPVARRVEFGCELPGRVDCATATPDGVVYCAVGTALYRIVEAD